MYTGSSLNLTDNEVFTALTNVYFSTDSFLYEDYVREYMLCKLRLWRTLCSRNTFDMPAEMIISWVYLMMMQAKIYDKLCILNYSLSLRNLDSIVELDPRITRINGCKVDYVYTDSELGLWTGRIILQREWVDVDLDA